MTRRLVLAACAWAAVLAQDQTCVDDPNWVKNGDEPWKDCAWAAEYVPTRCAVRGADGRDAREACPKACEECFPFAPTAAPSGIPTYGPTTAAPSDLPTSTPTAAPYAPTAVPTVCPHKDDDDWFKKDEPSKTCAWVAEFTPTRCQVRGEDGRTAQQACKLSCGHCGTYAPSLAPVGPSAVPTEVPTREPHYTVRVGFFPDDAPLPYMGGIGVHAFDDYTYHYAFYPMQTGAEGVQRLGSGELDIALLGTPSFATDYARGVDLTTTYIAYPKTVEDQLIVRPGIASPADLNGKRIASPYLSTAYFSLLVVQEVFKLHDMEIVALLPSEIPAAYNKGEIDGAFVWGRTKEELREVGHELLDAGLLASWGEPEFLIWAVSDEYAREHRDAVDRLMGLVARLDESFTAPGSTDKGGAWDPFDENGLVAAAVAARGGAFSSVIERRRLVEDMRTRTYVNVAEEPKELDAVEKAFDQNVEIAVQEKILHSAEPEGLWYPRVRPPRTSSAYLKRGYASTTDFEVDALSFDAEAWPVPLEPRGCEGLLFNRDPPPQFNLVDEGVLTDGSGDAPYLPNMKCTWVIRGDPVVRLAFDRVDVVTGDSIAVYEGTDPPIVNQRLLGNFSGLRGEDTASLVFEGKEALTVVFETDGFPNTVAVGEKTNYDPGFEATFSTIGRCTQACKGTCWQDVCWCPAGYRGLDCSVKLDACLGTALYFAPRKGSFESSPNALAETTLYGENIDCRFVVITDPSYYVQFSIMYDAELTFDSVNVLVGGLEFLDTNNRPWINDAKLSGDGNQTITVPTNDDGVAALHFLSDNVAGRSGFRASFEVLEQACVTDEDCGPGVCDAGDCRCPEGYVGVRCQSDHCLADSGTHAGPYVARSQAAGLLAEPETTCRWQLEPGRSDAAGARLRVTLADFEPERDKLIAKTACGEYPVTAQEAPRVYDIPGADCPNGTAGVIELFWQNDRNDILPDDLLPLDREGFVAEYRPLLACPAGVECNPDELLGARCEALACWVGDDAYDCEGCYGGSPPGYYLTAPLDEGGRIEPCPPGTEQPVRQNLNIGESSCIPCGPEHYAPEPATETCLHCPANSATYPLGNIRATSRFECSCKTNYYAHDLFREGGFDPEFECKSCPDDAQCLGGFVQPYPTRSYWLPPLTERGESNPPVPYRCRYGFFCQGGRRNQDYVKRAPRAECLWPRFPQSACVDGVLCGNGTGLTYPVEQFEVFQKIASLTSEPYTLGQCWTADYDNLELVDPYKFDGRGWCQKGRDVTAPLCADAVEKGRGVSYFEFSTLALRCPKNREARKVLVAFMFIGIFALFIIINDYLRPTFLFLDVVLNTYQDLGIISSYWLYWPARFDFIFTIFNIALFDINVFEPTCWWPWWGPNQEFYLMIGVPFIYAIYAFIVAFFMQRKDRHSYTHALSSCLRFLIGAQAALTNVVLSTIYCRNFRGVSPRRRVEAPEIGCHAQREVIVPLGAIYGIIFVLTIPISVGVGLLLARRKNLLRDPRILRRYGFLYEDFRAGALFWQACVQLKQLLLVIAPIVLWRYPLAQGYTAITILLFSVWLQARVRPYRKGMLNMFEQLGLMLTVMTVTLGLVFTSDILHNRSKQAYVFFWFALQAAFLAAALVFVRRHVVHVYKARLASYVIEYVGQLQKQKMEANPHRLVHSKSTLHGTRVGRTFVARLGSIGSVASVDSSLGLTSLPRRLSRTISPQSLFSCALTSRKKRNSVKERRMTAFRRGKHATLRNASVQIIEDPTQTREVEQHMTVRERLLQAFAFDAGEDGRGWAKCQQLLEDAPEEMMLTFKGPPLLEYVQTTQFADDAKAEVLALYHLEELMGPYLCDASWSSVYSREPLAEFYRRLQSFMPSLIDILLDAPPDRRATLAAAVSFLAKEFDERRAATDRKGGDISSAVVHSSRRSSLLYFLLHAPKNHYELAASFLRKLIVADPKRRKHRARYVALRAVVRIQRGFRARHLRRRTQRRSEMGPLPAIRETSSMRDSSIRSMGEVEGDDARPDLSGDSSGARLSLSAAAERIASSLSGGYQEYKE